MKLLGLLLLMVVASCNGKAVVDNHKWLDEVLEKANVAVRKSGSTILPIQSGQLNKISYSDGIILGLDSFYRTGASTNTFNGTHSLFDIHYGFRFLNAAFKNISINGNDMSASFRIRDNSIHLEFYLIRVYGCRVRLVNLAVERLSKIDFGSSRQEYDESDVEDFFGNEVLSAFNAYLNSHKDDIEKSLQFLCHPHLKNEYPEPLYLEFVEQFFYKNVQ